MIYGYLRKWEYRYPNKILQGTKANWEALITGGGEQCRIDIIILWGTGRINWERGGSAKYQAMADGALREGDKLRKGMMSIWTSPREGMIEGEREGDPLAFGGDRLVDTAASGDIKQLSL